MQNEETKVENVQSASNGGNALLCDGWFSSDNPPNDSRSVIIWTEQGMAEGSYSNGKFLQFRWSCHPKVICWRELPKVKARSSRS